MSKEKKELIEQFNSLISTVDDKKKQEQISEKLAALNNTLEHYDTKWENLVDAFTLFFVKNKKSRMTKIFNDVVDKYDKYSSTEKETIKNTLNEIVKICNENFWDKILRILGAS